MNGTFTDASFANQKSLLYGSGALHYRYSIGDLYNDAQATANAKDMCGHGLTLDLITDRFHSMAQIGSVLASLPASCVATLEGPNENDNDSQGVQYDPNYAIDLPAFMAALHKAFPHFPIIAPALTSTAAYVNVGDLGLASTLGNMHDYSPGFFPGIGGWGGLISPNPVCCYGSILWNIADAQLSVPFKPAASTESGYCVAPVGGCVPLDVQAKYIPRLILEHWLDGVPFSYLYALEATDATTNGGTLALVATTGTPYPAYYTLQSLQSTMAGDAPASDPISLSGGDATVRHVTMQDSAGHLHVALWLEAESYNPNANGGLGAEISVPSQSVQLSDGSVTATGTLTTCSVETTGQCSTSQVPIVSGAATITLTDAVQVLTI
jgi:hypothetical protein